MTTQDKVRVIAEYDGWEFIQNQEGFSEGYYLSEIWSGKYQTDNMEYLTSLDWLHPVAMKVLEEGEKIENPFIWEDAIQPVENACSRKPINGQYIDLFNSVYEGIIFLNSQKEKV